MRTAREILIRAREVIQNPAHWTKGSVCRDALGNASADVVSGASFCAIGAVRKVARWDTIDTLSAAWIAINDAAPAACNRTHNPYGLCPAALFNDHPHRTHEEVLEMFDRAIAQCPE